MEKHLFREACPVQPIASRFDLPVPVDVLRLDEVHPVVSGNKWFKLKQYVAAAKQQAKTTLLTFGGAYSNHIVATAAAAQALSFKSIGLIRGEEPRNYAHTLLAAKRYGMALYFLSRNVYREKTIPPEVYRDHNPGLVYEIPEGGYGEAGRDGAADILLHNATGRYTHIVAAVGTGTTLSGLVAGALPGQKVIGVPVLKNAFSLTDEINALLPPDKQNSVTLFWDYHFGGYARYTDVLLGFMNKFYARTALATDFVYTAKAFYAALDLLEKGYFPATSKLLLVHTGGLQGNDSLKKGSLIWT